ncbi:MAG: LamG domain-containing protein [Verrucomicrobia bacterium]|nr:LamG domain-containing protein [Verrucomicrobiota bacterium]
MMQCRSNGAKATLGMLLLAMLALHAMAAPPLVESRYLNPVYPENIHTSSVTNQAWYAEYTNTAGLAIIGGFTSFSTVGPTSPTGGLVIAESSFAEPIVGIGAAFALGDVLTAPADADLSIAPVLSSAAGVINAEWLDYAQILVATDMGAIEVVWTLQDGTTQIITYTISPQPNKRPVRLYWTEGQNSGPPIAFGSNYRVDLYYNNQIVDSNDVWISDNMLHAAEGAEGRFLLTYSRLDEVTEDRVLLAYEIVEVLEPMSAELAVLVGDRLFPQARPYGINDLFAEIVRGAIDPTGQDDPFVYQHTRGEKKGWVWGIRETAAPWQVEIYWKAKEELDVLWPFEVDIYGITWGVNAQAYVRGDVAEGVYEPIVYFPDDLLIELMPHEVPANHAVVDGKTFYTTDEGYCLLRYTYEDNVWFEPVRSVSRTDVSLDHTPLSAVIGKEIRPLLPASGDSLEAMYGEWPGYIYTPSGTAYNIDRYSYPATYTALADVDSYIFGVNQGLLEVWWSNASRQEDLPGPIFFPSIVNLNTCDWPLLSKDLVIASGEGSQGQTLKTEYTGCMAFDATQLTFEEKQFFGCHLWNDQPNGLDLLSEISLELWVRPQTLSGIQYLIYRGDNYRLRLNAGVPEFYAGGSWYSAGTSLVVDEWQHLAGTAKNASMVRFYVDGAPVHTASFGGWLRADMAAAFRIGARASGPFAAEGFFTGRMDEIRIWNDERSWDEIKTHTMVTVEPSAFGLRAYYRFEADELAAVGVVSDNSYFLNDLSLPSEGVTWDTPGIQQVEPGTDLSGVSASLYVQNDRDSDGFNPNEEHAIIIGGTVYALRNDLNVTSGEAYTSDPYVLLNASSATVNGGRPYMVTFKVVASNDLYQFRRDHEAGLMIQPPAPIAMMPPVNLEENTQVSGPVYRDRNRYYWAQQAGDDGGPADYVFDFYYPMQSSFFFPALTEQPDLGTPVAWLDVLSGDDTPIDFTYVVYWPEDLPVLYIADTLTNPKNDLPAIRGQLSVNVPYQQSLALDPTTPSVTLIDPTVKRTTELDEIPSGMKRYRDVRTACWFFSDMPPALRSRLFFNPMADAADALQLMGTYRERTDGHNYLLLNVLDGDNRASTIDESLITGITGTPGDPWRDAIAELPTEVVGISDDETPFDSLALPTTGLGTGYVTVVFNDSSDPDMVDPSEVVDMAIFRVSSELYRGRLDVILSDNPLDKQVNLYYTADFRGRPERWEFKWEWADPDDGMAPEETSTNWSDYVTATGQHFVTVGDAGVFGLSDHYLRCSYRATVPDVQAIVGTAWSGWTPPVLVEGWIKRVLKAINPYEQRILDFMNYRVYTALDMLQQIGPPYNGDIPLNYEALNEYGLMQIYETLNRQADDLSVNAGFVADDGLALALLMVKSRLSDLYMVLGNEAFGDALNPSIMLGEDDPIQTWGMTVGDVSSLFCFQNQTAGLLEEELALLRGRDDDMNPPVTQYPTYNRLAWNITADIVGGQVPYMLNYGISDLKGDFDGTLDADDAATQYPQGHGDAYGHYLSALKGYYGYLHQTNFSWYPQVEGIVVGDSTEVTISFLHEKKFVTAAAARARAGSAVINRTWRDTYAEDNGWQAARDSNTNRAWGVGEWGCRVGMGAYFDWLTANSLLPTSDPDPAHEGIRLIDRVNTPELAELANQGHRVQQQVDFADTSMNPLGITSDAVPFDISSYGIDDGQTHFEQMYDRALAALHNALGIHNRIKSCAQAIRDQNESADLDVKILSDEAQMNRELIGIYGYPYEDDIGPGKIYPQGYSGPDLLHYLYVDTWPLDPSIITDTRNVQMELTTYDYAWETEDITLAAPIFWGGDDQDYEITSVDYQSTATHTVDLNIAGNGIPVKPSSYGGQRRAEGTIQVALSEYLTAMADVSSAFGDAQWAADEVQREADVWLATYENLTNSISYRMDTADDIRLMQGFISALEIAQLFGNWLKDSISKVDAAIIEGIPKVLGLASDALAPTRGALKMSAKAIEITHGLTTVIGGAGIIGLKAGIEDEKVRLERDLAALDLTREATEAGYRILSLLQEQNNWLSTVQAQLQKLESARMRLSAAINQGDLLLMKRETARMIWASELNTSRYRNMAYRVFRNDELARYDEAFDMAARYVYLAAKAYDYETGLLEGGAEQEAGRTFMRQIVKARTLGRFTDWTNPSDGDPLTGGPVGEPGLADAMARMKANWSVLKGRLNFNNPQEETGLFSLRRELFRLSPEASSDESWQATLAAHKVSNIRDIPEFRRYCLPFDPIKDVEPGIVIPFSTTIDFGKNFFGRPLAAGDNAYDSTHFATKIRSVGVWFSNYTNAFEYGLANQPRIYLVPAGADSMRVTFGESSRIRQWQVVDQALPLPYPISDEQWQDPNWSMLADTLGNELYNTRRLPAMRAYHDGGDDPLVEVMWNSRLIGRSVWNSRWVLIIPGGTLLTDANEGLARFIYGRPTPAGTRDGEGVKDIKFYFHTYSYSGN